MCAVNDSIKQHDEDRDEDENNHLAGQCVTFELVGQVIVHTRHHQIEEQQDVGDDHDLDGYNEHVEVFARLLLCNRWEKSIEEACVVEQAPH